MGVTLDHDAVFELLGAWAVDACEDDETRAVEAHIAACSDCAREAARLREAAGWLGALEVVTPPPALEASVMAAARARRQPAAVTASSAAELVAHQADDLGVLLASLRPGEWNAATAAGWTVHELVGHLLAAASYLNWHLGLLAEDPAHGETDWVPRSEVVINGERDHDPGQTAAAWRVQAEILLAHVSAAGEPEMAAMIPWFGGQAPLAVLSVVHGFEAWVHAEDIRRATGRAPHPPSPADLACMSDMAVQLVAAAMRDDAGSPRRAHMTLTGPGGGEWTIGVGDGAMTRGPLDGEPVDLTLAADVVEFCTMVGGRLRPEELRCRVDGDRELADAVLAVAASFSYP